MWCAAAEAEEKPLEGRSLSRGSARRGASRLLAARLELGFGHSFAVNLGVLALIQAVTVGELQLRMPQPLDLVPISSARVRPALRALLRLPSSAC